MASSISEQRSTYSKLRLAELRNRLGSINELRQQSSMTVFGAGSYGRHEASEFSDIDMFFLSNAERDADAEPRTSSLRIFGKVIDTIDALNFPKFSNDCEYLVVLKASDLLSNLGSRTDDHDNYFTARMLLLLESQCLYGDAVYDQIVRDIVDSYFRDFPDHQETFTPIFLLNDICRFWKTLLLNYENKRNQASDTPEAQAKKTKQKVRNFKLKYSRMTTCFASIAALGSFQAPINQDNVIEITRLTPRERLKSVGIRMPSLQAEVNSLLDKYDWFLEQTGLSTQGLEAKFSDKQKRTEMFAKANEYGDAMYQLMHSIDKTDTKLKLVRNLVI